MRLPRGTVPAATLTVALLAARWGFPAPELSDPAGGPLPDGLALSTPPLYVALGPLFSLWDGVSMLSMSRLKGFAIGCGLLFLAWRLLALRPVVAGRARTITSPVRYLLRELGIAVAAVVAFAAFVVAGAVWHRPMRALVGAPSDVVVTDFHAHTTVSHDVDGLVDGYDLAANLRWHRRAGFDAVFITDHNTTAGWRSDTGSVAPSACPGVEVSAWRAHVVLLGSTTEVDRDRYEDSLDGVLALLRDAAPRYNALAVASLPEYDRGHWAYLRRWLDAGLDGFEVVNASPKANEFPRARRDSVIALARAERRFVVGVSDSHGWGATSMTWNLVPLPGWRDRRATLCADLVDALRLGGFAGNQVVERHRLRPDDPWPALLTPLGVAWALWRSEPASLAASWLAWAWLPVAVRAATRRGRRPAG